MGIHELSAGRVTASKHRHHKKVPLVPLRDAAEVVVQICVPSLYGLIDTVALLDLQCKRH